MPRDSTKSPTEAAAAKHVWPDQALLEEVVRRIVEVARPDRIILFGSAAREDVRAAAVLTRFAAGGRYPAYWTNGRFVGPKKTASGYTLTTGPKRRGSNHAGGPVQYTLCEHERVLELVASDVLTRAGTAGGHRIWGENLGLSEFHGHIDSARCDERQQF